MKFNMDMKFNIHVKFNIHKKFKMYHKLSLFNWIGIVVLVQLHVVCRGLKSIQHFAKPFEALEDDSDCGAA